MADNDANYKTAYDLAFYDALADGSLSSASTLLRLLWGSYQPDSVVDVGCGVGAWLSVASELGATEVLGLDGSYVPPDMLKIPRSSFQATDLTVSVRLNRRFDLAMSLEVAEHLPEQRARSFTADLAKLAPVVLFSAAVPGQGGTDHINEQWPGYWCDLFRSAGMVVYNPFRSLVWDDDNIEWWYRQNVLLFAEPGVALGLKAIERPQAMGHPRLVARLAGERYSRVSSPGFRTVIRQLRPSFVAAVRRRMKR